MSDRLLTSAELADLLGFAAGTVVDWAEKGAIPAFKIGGRLRFRETEVLDWLERQRIRKAGARGEAPATPQHPPGVVSGLPATPDRRGGEDAS
jgi:excisionase family DNA binding protein